MDVSERPSDTLEHKHLRGRDPITEIEVVGLVALAMTIVLDVLSRFMLRDQPAFRLATFLSVVAATCAVIDAVLTAKAFQRHPHAFKLHLAADVSAAVLLLATVALRFYYWDAHLGTPIRAIAPAVLAFLLIGFATWANLTDHSGDDVVDLTDDEVAEAEAADADDEVTAELPTDSPA